MKKTLITVDNLEEFICRVEKKIYVDGMILTPGAKDALHKQGVGIIHGPCPEAAVCTAHERAPDNRSSSVAGAEDERLFYGIAAMLRDEYGIQDLQSLRDLSLKAAKIIKQNI